MKAWILDEPQKLHLEEFEPSTLTDEQVKVKVEEVILTSTDFCMYNGQIK